MSTSKTYTKRQIIRALEKARASRDAEERATRGDHECEMLFSGWSQAFDAAEEAVRKLKTRPRKYPVRPWDPDRV